MATECKPPISKPIGLTALAAMVLVGCSKPALYRRIHAGSIPVLPMPGEWRISVAGLERFADRPFTIEEITNAEGHAREIRAANLAAKHARAKKKAAQS